MDANTMRNVQYPRLRFGLVFLGNLPRLNYGTTLFLTIGFLTITFLTLAWP